MSSERHVHYPELGWLADMDHADQRRFLGDLAAAIDAARATGDRGLIERCLHEWRLTVAAMEVADWRERLRSDE